MDVIIKNLLKFDQNISEYLAKIGSNGICTKLKIKKICFLLEFIMHGIPWIFGMFISIIYAHLNNWPTSKINFLNLIIIGLFFDLALIGLLKILFRRDRPNKRKIFLGAPIIDNYSFPSGHVSRATMISICFIIIIKLNYFNFVIILFPLILAFSRVLSGEHFISDVIAGLLIGCFEAFIFIILMQERLKD